MKYTIKPSDWVNLPYMCLAFVAGMALAATGSLWCLLLIVPYIWKSISIYFWEYSFDEETEVMAEKKGVFTRNRYEIHYFRIKSIKVNQPFFFRIFGLSNVDIVTSEPFKPFIRIYGIKNGEEVAQFIEELAVVWRDQRGVKETDFHKF